MKFDNINLISYQDIFDRFIFYPESPHQISIYDSDKKSFLYNKDVFVDSDAPGDPLMFNYICNEVFELLLNYLKGERMSKYDISGS